MKILKLNAIGRGVPELQKLLQKQGMAVLLHGTSDEVTKAAIIGFHRKTGWMPTAS